MQNTYEGIDPIIVKMAVIKAGQLIGKYGFTSDDFEDIVQEIVTDTVMRAKSFDLNRSTFEKFVLFTTNRKTATLIEHNKTLKRKSNSKTESLDTVMDDRVDAGMSQADDGVMDENAMAERIDFKIFLSTFSPYEKELFYRLLTESVIDVARHIGVDRKTIYRHTKELNAKLAAGGYETFF